MHILFFSLAITTERCIFTSSQLTMGCIFEKCSQVNEEQENTNAEPPQPTFSWYDIYSYNLYCVPKIFKVQPVDLMRLHKCVNSQCLTSLSETRSFNYKTIFLKYSIHLHMHTCVQFLN